jgi:hypothetical protein
VFYLILYHDARKHKIRICRDGRATLLDIKETEHKGFLYQNQAEWQASVTKIRR